MRRVLTYIVLAFAVMMIGFYVGRASVTHGWMEYVSTSLYVFQVFIWVLILRLEVRAADERHRLQAHLQDQHHREHPYG